MKSDTNNRGKDEYVDLAYRTCRLGHGMECDGLEHYWAAWDEDLCKWVHVNMSCPLRHWNRARLSYERFRDDGLSHHAAVAMVRAHGGDL